MSLLDEYIERWRAREFDWTLANCCHFAGGWVAAVEDWDPMSCVRPVAGEDSARDLVRVYGSLGLAVTTVLRRSPMPSLLAGVGDLVLLSPSDENKNGSVGICNGRRAFFLSHKGVAVSSMSLAAVAWRIGGER